MGLQFRTITQNLRDINLIPRFRTDKFKHELISLEYLKKNYFSVTKDAHGEYTFTSENLQFTSAPHQEFYDGEVKVLESWYDEKRQSLVLQILSTTQTNLFIDLDVHDCIIKAEGSLCIDGKFNIQSALDIAAANLCLLDAIECDGRIGLKAGQGLFLSSPLKAKHLEADAVYLQHSATIQVEGQYDLSAQMTQQSPDSKIETNALRLISKQCEIAGALDVSGPCFLVAEDLVLGDSGDTITNINLRGEHHIHAISGLVQGNTQILIDNEQIPLSKKSQCIFDEYLYIEPSSTLNIKKTTLDIDALENEGSFFIDYCEALFKNIEQKGYLEATNSTVVVSGQFDHVTADLSFFEKSSFQSPSTIINGGSVEFNHSEWTGELIHVLSGLLHVVNSDVYLEKSITTDEMTRLEMQDSLLDAIGNALFLGAVSLEQNAEIKCNVMSIKNTKLNLREAILSVDTELMLDGDLDISNSTMRAKNILVSGILDLKEVMLYADRLHYKSHQAKISDTIAMVDILFIEGSETKGAVLITEGCHTAKTFKILNQVVIKNSKMVGIDDTNVCHDISGKLFLENSSIITESQLHHLKGSHLELCSLSSILAGDIHSKGNISAETSAIQCDALFQNGAPLNVKESTITVKNTLKTSNAQVNVDKTSALATSEVHLGNNTSLRLVGKSTLFATQQVISDSSSSIESVQSTLVAQKLVLLGRTELQKSLLSSKELLIYNQFDAKDKTIINIEERISLAKTANVELKSSAISACDIDSFGHLSLAESQINAKETISLWTDSDTQMNGAASITAQDAVLRGALCTKKNILENKNQPPTPEAKAILKIKNSLHVSPNATVTGNGELGIDSDVITWLGTAHLDANFSAKGSRLSNSGCITAKSIFLGFDDAVINYGSFFANSMSIHSNFFNILGGSYVQESFSCSGFMSVNLGIIVANNYNNESFLSLQSGLVLPFFSADPTYIFSSAPSMAKTAAIMIMPSYTNSIKLVGMIPGAINTAKSIYSWGHQLDLETMRNLRRHELMPLLCKIKNTGMFVHGAVNTSISTIQNDIKIWDTSLHNLLNDPHTWGTAAWSAMQSIDYKKLEMRAAGLFAGSYTDNSLLNINTGGMFAGNTSINSYGHLNTGLECSAFSHNINSSFLSNFGTSTGREACFLATGVKNSGILAGTTCFTLNADKVENSNTGTLQGDRANVEIKTLQQDGYLNMNKGHLKVEKFIDDVDSNTKLTDVMLSGDTFDQLGKADFNNVLIEETEHYITHVGAQEKNNNVAIKTQDFEHHGTLNYENKMSITAVDGMFAKDSVVSGEKTDVDELFVPKEVDPKSETKVDDTKQNEETAKTGSETTEDKSQPSEKDFKPEHILLLNIDHQVLNGKLTGGDYTQIKGKNEDLIKEDGTKESALCEDLTIGESAQIDLKHGSIETKKGNASSRNVVLDNFNITIKEGSFNPDSTVTLKNSTYTGDVLDEEGSLILDHSHAKVTNIHLGQDAHETLIDSTIISGMMIDESQMSYQGQAALITDSYEHTGHVGHITAPPESENKNLFYVKAKTAKLDGSTNLDNGYYDIEHLADGTQFAAGTGKYSLYLASESMSLKTEDSFHLYESIQRNCDVSVQAADIYYGGALNCQHDLTLVSTLGDVTLTNNLQARNLFVKSAKNIYTNSSINTESLLNFEAEGGYYNYGGTLNGNNVAIKASEIKNYTRGSSAVVWGTLLPMGNAGVINARSKLFLEATRGNIENHGGVLRAGDYAQLLAKSNVVNVCNVKTSQGQYDTLQQFDGGLIAGGSGKDTEGFGLYIKAEGQVISDASDFISNGSNYIEGVKGVQFTARSHTAITKYESNKTWYGKKRTIVETSTLIKGCNIQSANGRNIIQSGEGAVTSVASKFISPGGTDIAAKGDIKLFSLKTQDRRIESKSYLWGLTKKNIDSIHQNATPTLFYDNGATRITSAEGNVDARGAYFIGAGDLSIKAKKQILLGVDILNHEIKEKSNSFSFSGPGLGAWDAYQKGGNAWDIITAEDATLAKMNSLYDSHNAYETLANSSNLGIDLYNTSNSFMRGLSQSGLIEELMARYGIGGAAGFSPSLTLSMTQSKRDTQFQTQSLGGIDCGGNVKLEAGEGVMLENGVGVHAGGHLEIDAPILVARSAALNTKGKETRVTESLGITPLTGQVQSVGMSYSSTQTQSTTYQNAKLSADDNMYLHNHDKAMDLVELDGANILAKTLDMNTNKLVIRDKQDTSQTKTESFSVNTSGQFSVYEGKGREKVTNQSSGIYVADGINTDGHKVHAGETYMEGGKILTDGVNRFETDKLESHTHKDEKEFSGVGINGNVNDLKRFTELKPENIAGEQTIATATFSYDKVDYQAMQQSVIYGAQGTEIEIKEFVGDTIHTTSADGLVIQKDTSLHLQVDIPITNEAYLKTHNENIKAGKEKLADIFGLNQNDKDPMAFGRAEPMIPVEEEEEEEEEEDNELDLASAEAQEILAGAMENLKFDSPEQEQEFQNTAAKAEQEIKKNGKMSPKTESQLKAQVTEALIKTLKAGSEDKWGKLIEKMGPDYQKSLIKLLSNPDTSVHAGIKSYMTAKGVAISFMYNLILASMDSKVDKGDEIKHAAAETAAEITFGFVLKLGIGMASRPVNAGLFVFSIADCFYSEKRVNELNTSGVSHIYDAQRLSQQGHPLDAWGMRQLAADELRVAAMVQAGHFLANITQPISELFENKWNEYINKHQKNKKSPPAAKATSSTQGMFKYGPAPDTDEYHLQQLGLL